jgi:uncharacterized protein (TIGR00255 family)
MTGFAAKIIEVPAFDNNKAYLSMTLKSLNSRFFEATCKLPHALQSLEIELIKLLKESLHRGKVSFIITMSNPLLFKGPVEPSFYMVQSYLEALEQIQKKYTIPGTISITELMNLPHIFIEEEASLNETMQHLILATTKQLIIELRIEQKNEGVALQKDIEERIVILKQEINDIEQLATQLAEKNKIEVQKKLTHLEKSSSDIIDLTRHQLYSELERLDIHEEIVRFKSHLSNLSDFISSDQKEKGRRIDFTLQELTREINTIGAKCSDPSIGSRAITIKVELEKIREQAQNIV